MEDNIDEGNSARLPPRERPAPGRIPDQGADEGRTDETDDADETDETERDDEDDDNNHPRRAARGLMDLDLHRGFLHNAPLAAAAERGCRRPLEVLIGDRDREDNAAARRS
ncbi:hypothetical protein WMF45_16740 [Sorangium sp. So ce448]|uniref:hypothetical protein n=1 Tax=Sorangium sp. So ce448 TaxID=3133314 RepID=UPI003F6334D6